MRLRYLVSEPASIVVFRALVLGDMLCAVPALRSLRHAFPRAHVTLVGLPWARSFAARFSHLMDDFMEFPGYPGLPEVVPDIRQLPPFFAGAQQRRFDVAIQLHGSGRDVNAVTAMLGARHTAGFYIPGEYCPDARLFMPFPGDGHEILKCLRLMEHLGVQPLGTHLEFPIMADDHLDFRRLQAAWDIPPEYVCIHAGSRLLSRRWVPERFAEVADHLAALGLGIILTGSKEEEGVAGTVSRHMAAPHLNLTGRTSLGALAVLLSKARLLISNDTGVSHVAAALRVPSVVIVTGSDPKRWAPLDQDRHRTVFAPVDCRPCTFSFCPIGQLCAAGVDAADVIRHAEELVAVNIKEGAVYEENSLD